MLKTDTVIGVFCSIEIQEKYQLCSLLHKDFMLLSDKLATPMNKETFMKVHESIYSGLFDFYYHLSKLEVKGSIVSGFISLDVKKKKTIEVAGIEIISDSGQYEELHFGTIPFNAHVDNDEISELTFFESQENSISNFLENAAKLIAIKELVN